MIGIYILLTMMVIFLAIIMMTRTWYIGLLTALFLSLSVCMTYVTMGFGQYKSSLETLLDSGLTYDVLYYQFPKNGPVIFLLKTKTDVYPKYYLITMSDKDKDKNQKLLMNLEKKKIKLGHGKIQLNGGTEDEDYGIVLDTNEHRPELEDKENES